MASPDTWNVAAEPDWRLTLFMVSIVVVPDVTVSVDPLSVAVSPLKFAPSKMNSSPLAMFEIVRLVVSPVVNPIRGRIPICAR
jgi:hypothetical protein